MLDNQDNELASSARPAMLPHTSGLRKGIGMFFSWPLHVLGLKSEADTVVVTLMDFYEVSIGALVFPCPPLCSLSCGLGCACVNCSTSFCCFVPLPMLFGLIR